MTDPSRRIADALVVLERRWRDRGIVLAILLVALVAALVLLRVDDSTAGYAPWAALALLVVGSGYGAVDVVHFRRSRRAIRALVLERERMAAASARVGALEDLQTAAREVVAAEDLQGVFDRLLAAARALTHADSGVVLLRVGEELTVAAANGREVPDRGEAFGLDEGLAGTAVRAGAPMLIGQGAPWGAAPGSSSIAAPLRLPDRTVGVLVVSRDARRQAFGSADLAVVALFADHAALAVRNAWRLDGERRDAQDLRVERDALAHDLQAALAVVSGYVALLRERGDGFGVERRQTLLEDVLRELSAMRERVDRKRHDG